MSIGNDTGSGRCPACETAHCVDCDRHLDPRKEIYETSIPLRFGMWIELRCRACYLAKIHAGHGI